MEPDTSHPNRKREELTIQEARVLGTYETCIILRKTVFLYSDKRKVNEKHIIITKNRFYVRSPRTPSKVDFSINLLRIRSLYCKDAKHVTLGVEKVFGSPGGSRGADVVVTNLDFIVEPGDQEELVVALLTPLKPLGKWHDRIQVTIEPKERSIRIFRSLSESAALLTSSPDPPCDGFNLVYPLLCDLYEVPLHEEVLWDIENTYFSRGRKQLSLCDFSHLPSKDLLPILAAMEYNEYFEGLSLVDSKLTTEGIEVLQKILKSNTTLTQLKLRNVGLKPESIHRLMTRALAANSKSSLSHLDLSDNPLEDRGVIDIANALEKLPNLAQVVLTRCLMTSKGCYLLANSLNKNRNAKNSLVEISIGENPLYQGNNLHGFLKYIASPNVIQKLDLSFCGIPLEFLCNALAQSSLHTLEELYFACNVKLPQGHKFHSITSPYYKHFFSSTRSLRYIDISNCKLHPDTLLLILEGLRENVSDVNLVLDLSGNIFTPRSQEIAGLIGEVSILQTLRICNVGLNEHFEDIISKICSNPNLKHLYVGKNFRKSRWAAGEAIQIFATHSELESLSLSDCKLKDALQFLIRSLKHNHTLKALDISGNQMGDAGARLLAKVLHMNSTLQTLNYDQNNLTPSGLAYICSALKSNHSLRDISFPLQDLFQIKRDYEKDKFAIGRAEVSLKRIEERLKRNHSQNKHTLELRSAQDRRAVRILSIRQSLEQTAGRMKGLVDRTVRNKETRVDIRDASNLLGQLEECLKLSQSLYPDSTQQSDAMEISSTISQEIHKLAVSLYHQHVTSSNLMRPARLNTSCPGLIPQEILEPLQKDVSDTARESENKLTEELLSSVKEVSTAAVMICNIDLCLLTLDRVVTPLLQSSEQVIGKLKALQSESGNVVAGQESVAERITSSISSRPVSYLARTPPMQTRITDSLNSIEEDTDSRLSLSLITPVIPDEPTATADIKPIQTPEAVTPVITRRAEPHEIVSQNAERDSLDLESSTHSEMTEVQTDHTPMTSPSVDSDRVRSALDFFDQSLQLESSVGGMDDSLEVDLDLITAESKKLEFLTKERAPQPKGRRPQPRPRQIPPRDSLSDIFLEVAHTAVAGIEDKSCQIQLKQSPPRLHTSNNNNNNKTNFKKSVSAENTQKNERDPMPVHKSVSQRKEIRSLTIDAAGLQKIESAQESRLPLTPTLEPPAKPARNPSLHGRPVPPLRKKPAPPLSSQEPVRIISVTSTKPPSKSYAGPVDTKPSSDDETEKHNSSDEATTLKSASPPLPRERFAAKKETDTLLVPETQVPVKPSNSPKSALASMLKNALSRSPPKPKDSPVSLLKKDPPPLPTKSPMRPPAPVKPLPPPGNLTKSPLTKIPQRPTSPPKGIATDLPPKPVPPPRNKRENLEKPDRSDRDSVLI